MENNLLKLAEQRLNKAELNYFRIIYGRALVLMLKGRPGAWKSAILKSIADKLDMVFVDLRLPTMDEVDLGAFPVVNYVDKLPVVSMGIPDWAMETRDTKKNFLIVCEELNRASTAVRNAALGFLNEKRIGPKFVFGDNVYFAATGNLGQEDGTDVEEFDLALKGRLVTVHHNPELVEWMDNFAKDQLDANGKVIKEGNVHKDIIAYLEAEPSEFYPAIKEQGGNDQGDAVTQPRTWTGLSETIIRNFGKDAKPEQYMAFVEKFGKNFVGSRITRFIRFINENVSFTFDDVLSGKVKDYSKIKRDNRAEIIRAFEVFDINTLKKDKKGDAAFKNLVAFLRSVDHDLLVGAIKTYVDNRLIAMGGDGKPGERERDFKKEFDKEMLYLIKLEEEDEKNNNA